MAKKDVVLTAEVAAPQQPKFDFVFVVFNPFGDYKKGERISEDDAMQAVMDAGNAIHCNRVPR